MTYLHLSYLNQKVTNSNSSTEMQESLAHLKEARRQLRRAEANLKYHHRCYDRPNYRPSDLEDDKLMLFGYPPHKDGPGKVKGDLKTKIDSATSSEDASDYASYNEAHLCLIGKRCPRSDSSKTLRRSSSSTTIASSQTSSLDSHPSSSDMSYKFKFQPIWISSDVAVSARSKIPLPNRSSAGSNSSSNDSRNAVRESNSRTATACSETLFNSKGTVSDSDLPNSGMNSHRTQSKSRRRTSSHCEMVYRNIQMNERPMNLYFASIRSGRSEEKIENPSAHIQESAFNGARTVTACSTRTPENDDSYKTTTTDSNIGIMNKDLLRTRRRIAVKSKTPIETDGTRPIATQPNLNSSITKQFGSRTVTDSSTEPQLNRFSAVRPTVDSISRKFI